MVGDIELSRGTQLKLLLAPTINSDIPAITSGRKWIQKQSASCLFIFQASWSPVKQIPHKQAAVNT